MLDLDRLLRAAAEQRASDLHLKVGARPWIRVDGSRVKGPFDTIGPNDTEDIAGRIIPEARATPAASSIATAHSTTSATPALRLELERTDRERDQPGTTSV